MSKETLPGAIRKIVQAEPNTFVVYFREGCPYSMRAINLLKGLRLPSKCYDVENMSGNKPALLNLLRSYASLISYTPSHTTVPMIFYNGKFIGGCAELERMLSQ